MWRFLLLLALVVVPAQAAQVTINIPDAVQETDTVMCEDLRIQMRATTASWSTKVCVEEFTRRGLRGFKREEVIRDSETQRQSDLTTERDLFDGRFPVEDPVPGRPDPPNIMRCGDNELENDPTIPHTEECDDGGESATCDGNCTNAVCGDGTLNVTAGETCDDGNTTPGDGCDASCQTEGGASNDMPNDVHLAWDAGGGGSPAVGYRVYLGTAPGVYPAEPATEVSGLTTIIADLVHCTRYYSVVRPYNQAGEGGSSNEITFVPDHTCDS